jgi:hypothetical protein
MVSWAGPPPVITYTMSKVRRAKMTLTTPTTTSGRRSDGTRMCLAVCQALAPSTLAASTSS